MASALLLVVRRGRSQRRSGDDRIEAQAGISVDACPGFPTLDVAPPAIYWGAREIAIDAFHHAVYAAAARTPVPVARAVTAFPVRADALGLPQTSSCISTRRGLCITAYAA